MDYMSLPHDQFEAHFNPRECTPNIDERLAMGREGRERVIAEFGADATTRGVKNVIDGVLSGHT